MKHGTVRLSKALLVAVVVLAILPGGGATAAPGDTSRVSLTYQGAQGLGGSSYSPSVSADGEMVAFVSTATNLIPGDNNAQNDIFFRNRAAHDTGRASGPMVAGANGSSTDSTISADGRYVAFKSFAANLVPDDTNGTMDIFRYDVLTGEIVRASITSDEVQAYAYTGAPPTISGDGRYVAFNSEDSGLVPDDDNGHHDVFVRDCLNGTTERITDGGDGDSQSPSISYDGRYVAFTSYASDLVVGDENGAGDIYVHDRSTGTTERVSVSSAGAEGDGESYASKISADGRYVTFVSAASTLVSDDTNGSEDVFVHDRQGDLTTRVSVNAAGEEADSWSSYPSISAHGRYVAFESSAQNLLGEPYDTDAVTDVFVVDRTNGAVQRVSVSSAGVPGNGDSNTASLYRGDIVAFESSASNLIGTGVDTNGQIDVFVHETGWEPDADTVAAPLLSQGTRDGWILETSEDSGIGGTKNASSSTLRLGDNASAKQYRSILSFNTSSLPAKAVITSATLKIKRSGMTGGDPFGFPAELAAAIKKPRFGTQAGLQLGDFKATPNLSDVAMFPNDPLDDWYSARLLDMRHINKDGTTQFRLAFTMDDDDDTIAEYLQFFSGNASSANRPRLLLEYFVPFTP